MGLFVYLCIYKQKQVECSFKRQIINNVLIITSSMRHVSNSDALAEAFAKRAAENESYVPERTIAGLDGWIDGHELARLAGSVFAGGVNDPEEIKGHTALVRAYEMGKTV